MIVEQIRRKRDGDVLSSEEWRHLIESVVSGSLPDYQLSALLMAVFFRGLAEEELLALTAAMVDSGERLAWKGVDRPIVDKHSTGGVGDKISFVVAPIVAAAGGAVPMMSGRGLGITGGTLDKLQSIPGFRIELGPAEMECQLAQLGLIYIGQSSKICPADKKIYALRDVTGTVECIPLIVSSIVSKKIAEGAEAIVFDVKVGSGAMMKTIEQGRALAAELAKVAKRAGGLRAVAMLTQMNVPLGKKIGNALEIEESVAVLKGEGPRDVAELSLRMAAEMLVVAGLEEEIESAYRKADGLLKSGAALERFRSVVEAQGGDPGIVDFPEKVFSKARSGLVWSAPRKGYLSKLDAGLMGLCSLLAGAGRASVDDKIDPAVGFTLHHQIGDRVEAGEAVLTCHYNDEKRIGALQPYWGALCEVKEEKPPPLPLIYEILR